MRNKILFSTLGVVLLAGTFAGGVFFGYRGRSQVERVYSLIHKEDEKPANVDFAPFWKAWNELHNKYIGNDDLSSEKLVWGSIEGMVKSLDDPYTIFFPPAESKVFEETIAGNFEGVGMEIGTRNGVLVVVAPLKDTPAYRAGIKAGDKIIKIDGTPSGDFPPDKAIPLIKGKKGTRVKLTLAREGRNEPLEITVTRDVIKIPILDTEKKGNGIFLVKLYNFSANSAYTFRLALREFISSGSNKLIIDLRGNPGGYLESSVDMASWFLPMGDVVAREKFANGEEVIYRSKGYDAFKNLPLILLVDAGSASASEIFAGALRESGVAKLVGEKTFGKGSVQQLVNITPETSLKITVARWLTPNGVSISKEGLTPDYEVKIPKEKTKDNGEKETFDPQMDKAIELLSE